MLKFSLSIWILIYSKATLKFSKNVCMFFDCSSLNSSGLKAILFSLGHFSQEAQNLEQQHHLPRLEY